jgi:hypothetical protein
MDLVECVSDRCGSALMPRPHWLRGNPSARSDILTRTPWLLAIGRMLRADYTEEEQLLPERLAALAKKLEGPSPASARQRRPRGFLRRWHAVRLAVIPTSPISVYASSSARGRKRLNQWGLSNLLKSLHKAFFALVKQADVVSNM